jgi:acetyl esterase/lipase
VTVDWKLPPLRQGVDADDALAQTRAMVASGTLAEGFTGTATTSSGTLGGRPAVFCVPEQHARTILYLHGGGYRLGHAPTWTPFGAHLASVTASQVVLLDYRVAPEDPFPAAIHDVTAAYEELVAADHGPVVVAGDSAGGGLTAALTIACLRAGVDVPAGTVLISPWLDLTVTASSYESRDGIDNMFSRATAQSAAELYLQGAPAKDELASPMFADVTGFPPTLLFAGTSEVLLEDSLGFAARLALAHVDVELHVASGMQHVWPTLQPALPQTEAAFDAITRFVARVA